MFNGDASWRAIDTRRRPDLRAGTTTSTYVQQPALLRGHQPRRPTGITDINGARILGLFGDKITTDHISPAGSIKPLARRASTCSSTAWPIADFNQYGTRRGNHEVMMRGTFANIRIKNFMARMPPATSKEGGTTVHYPTGEQMSIYDAAMRYKADGVPLVVFAGVEYGNGSSRDWAAKGTNLLGVQAP